MSEKALLVLDLDETLVHSDYEPHPGFFRFEKFGYHIHARPWLLTFLQTIKPIFDVGLWTAGDLQYGEAIADFYVRPVLTPIFVFGRDRCTMKRDLDDIFGSGDGTYNSTKPLRKLKRFGYPLKRTLIVEDDPVKVRGNYGNAIYVKAFEGDVEDDQLRKLGRYLLDLEKEPDFLRVEKRGWSQRY